LDTRGAKTGIDVIDVATGERRHLADYVCGGGGTIGNYSFNPRVLSWASARIHTAVAAGCDLIVIDEIGPLELVHQDGLVAALDLLADLRAVPHALVIVRHAYLDRLKQRLSRPDLSCFWVDEGRPEGLAYEIAAALEASIRNDGS
jgi:nucleoside-triphosphatase THEP1